MQGLDCYRQFSKLLNDMAKGEVHFYDQLMLGCEEKNLGRGLPPAKFFSNKAIERLFNLLKHIFTQVDICIIICT